MRSLTYKFIYDRTILELVIAHYTALTDIKTTIKDSYRKYVLKKASPSIPPLAVSPLQRHALELAYTNKSEAAGLGWLNSIYINGLGSCPFCGGDGARTIEHYLPQTSYPEFSIFSLNLMPSCGDCNRKRNASNAHGAKIKLLHPYFDRSLLDKISLYTSIDLKFGIPSFAITYDRNQFEEEYQARIDHHIDTSIDDTAFFNRTWASLEALKIHAEKCNSVQELKSKILDEQIYVCEATGDLNSWHHALCKGIMRLNDDEINEIFKNSFGRRVTQQKNV
ncbi:hypothetical protein [Pseudomonas chlororaphis]|uniref:hypothetical protein n=1 Tax=Pseudomonas chlororaphis TaxID=587753 RepID=UPI000A615968|nr:hypothetical protein [Pseudomonas chlororaphis]